MVFEVQGGDLAMLPTSICPSVSFRFFKAFTPALTLLVGGRRGATHSCIGGVSDTDCYRHRVSCVSGGAGGGGGDASVPQFCIDFEGVHASVDVGGRRGSRCAEACSSSGGVSAADCNWHRVSCLPQGRGPGVTQQFVCVWWGGVLDISALHAYVPQFRSNSEGVHSCFDVGRGCWRGAAHRISDGGGQWYTHRVCSWMPR